MAAPAPRPDLWTSLDGRCGRAASVFEPYHWPVRPFDRQHPVRGFFGDPRTYYAELAGMARPTTPGLFSFHNGVDVAARGGTDVYPVVSGTVVRASVEEVVVRTGDGRSFQYWHLRPTVTVGTRVTAFRTVIGRVRPAAGHVHLTEMRDGCAVNPLAPGHLTPYRDLRRPLVLQIEVRTRDGALLDPRRITRPFELDASAEDLPWPAVPGLWHGMPVTPALVRWRLTGPHGRPVVLERTAADFRITIPPNGDFWRVYAADTHENFPEVPFRTEALERGDYIFRLTPPCEPLSLPPGTYTVTVTATDTAGNSDSLSRQIVVRTSRV
jgi:hypothetical protein